MSAQPVEPHDPASPSAILATLPPEWRPVFLTDYQAALDAARDPAGYEALPRTLRRWRVRAAAYAAPDFAEARAEAERPDRSAAVTWEQLAAERGR
ncbi:DUF6247 family protein [Actinomadura kijaniata]|uniref:DUF6247 family protein n=1 Tax=Actinomadura kijaniata TaxID=46161 RepID=UPI00082CE6EF|nr:DUF6247 family protein [Actinomadura kijaniata]